MRKILRDIFQSCSCVGSYKDILNFDQSTVSFRLYFILYSYLSQKHYFHLAKLRITKLGILRIQFGLFKRGILIFVNYF